MTVPITNSPLEKTPLLVGDSPNELKLSVNQSVNDDQELEFSQQVTTVDKKRNSKWRQCWKSLVLYLLTIIMVVAKSCDTVLYVRLTYEIQNYIYMLTNFVNVAYVIILFPIVVFQIWRGKITKAMRETRQYKYIVMAFLDNATNTLSTIPAAFVSGSVNTMLSQAVIVLNIAFSFIFLHARYNSFHMSGVILVICGLVINIYPLFAQGVSISNDDTSSNMNWLWVLLLFSSNIPAAASNVYKEKCLKQEQLDVWLVNYWVSVWQVLFGILTSLFVFVPLPGTSYTDWFGIPAYIWGGIKCSVGVNTIIDGAVPDRCEGFPAVFWIDLFFNFTYATLELYVFQYGSSTLAVIAAVSRLALSNLFFLVKFVAGEAFESQLSLFDVISLIILVLGIVVYSLTKEQTAHKDDKFRKVQETMYEKICHSLKSMNLSRYLKSKLFQSSLLQNH